MIVKLLMDAIKAVILIIIGLFPPLPDMSGIVSALSPIIDVLRTVDSIVSVQLFAVCVGFLFVFVNLDFVWSIIMWVIRKIPGVS